MSKQNNFKEMLKKVSIAFNEMRSKVLPKIANVKIQFAGDRKGDKRCILDIKATTIFKKYFPEKVYLYCCEEQKENFENQIINDKKHFIILDAIDGTNNMLTGLPFGINVALGQIPKDHSDIMLKHIKAVFIANYITQKTYTWDGRKVDISPAKYDDKINVKSKRVGHYDEKSPKPLILEAPDSHSYIDDNYPEGNKRQQKIITVFKSLFNDSKLDIQRRAIDCTGLRLAEMSEGNVIAYADLRWAASIWDTIPSIRLLLESSPQLDILDGRLHKYTNETVIFKIDGRNYKFNDDVGKQVIVLEQSLHKKLLAHLLKSPVFIVHGRDVESAKKVVDFISSDFGLPCTILADKPSQKSSTIMEKLMKYSEAQFAVILMTPDDEGRLNRKGSILKTRARQNVIFELGLFIGKLGKENVILMNKNVEEEPSDIKGVIYVPMNGDWRQILHNRILEIIGWYYHASKTT